MYFLPHLKGKISNSKSRLHSIATYLHDQNFTAPLEKCSNPERFLAVWEVGGEASLESAQVEGDVGIDSLEEVEKWNLKGKS